MITSLLDMQWSDIWPAERTFPASLGIALSGGMDSTVLLHWLYTNAPKTISLRAYHVYHALQPEAYHWIEHCQKLCDTLSIPFLFHTLDPSTRNSAESIEAWARKARYHWLAQQPVELIALGHHETDQAETLLLQLLRGAGVTGLASMASLSYKHRQYWWRPLLKFPRSELLNYAHHHQLQWIEDPSNEDTRYARNWMRHILFPLLKEQYPQAESCLSRSAAHCAEIAAFVDSTIQKDLFLCSPSEDQLHLETLKKLSVFQQKHVLRAFMRKWTGYPPSTHVLEQALSNFLKPLDPERHRPQIRSKELCFTVWQNQLWAHLYFPEPKQVKPLSISPQTERIELTGGQLHINFPEPVSLSPNILNSCFIIQRRGGEQIRLSAGTSRSLKRLWQKASSLPPWDRNLFPCIVNQDHHIIWAPLHAHYNCTPYKQAQPASYTGTGILLEHGPSLEIRWIPYRPKPVFMSE